MFRSLREIENAVLEASDGEIGRCKDFLFDDVHWAVRYMVADTRKWLPGRKVLISPAFLEAPDWEVKHLPVALTQKEIEDSPPLESDRPVSKEYEALWVDHFHLPHYWVGPGALGAPPVPVPLAEPNEVKHPTPGAEEENHLRSQKEVRGYRIQAGDGGIGHVEDFLADDTHWVIRYLIVDTRNWLPGKKVIVAPHWAESIDWAQAQVNLRVRKETVENAPEYISHNAVDRAFEARLHQHYDFPYYW